MIQLQFIDNMGNEQEKVMFQGQVSNSRRKNIFRDSHVPSEVLSHSHAASRAQGPSPLVQAKLAQSGSIKSSNGNRSVKMETPNQHIQHIMEETIHSEIPPAERYPTKIPYFNAWSLPIQKYYLEERGPYQPEQEPVAVPERRQMREFNPGALQQIMAEKMKEEMIATQRNKRRQNLNMV